MGARRWPVIAAELRALVSTMEPGDRLPSENELIARLGAARLTVRKALRALEADHLVDPVQGRGRFVLGPEQVPAPRLDAAHDRIVISVRAALADIGPGRLVTTTAEICKLHDVSAPTARKALRALVAQGVLVHVHRTGWFTPQDPLW